MPHHLGLPILTLEQLEVLHPKWDVIAFALACEHLAVVLSSHKSAEEVVASASTGVNTFPPPANDLILVLGCTDEARDKTNESWAWSHCRAKGIRRLIAKTVDASVLNAWLSSKENDVRAMDSVVQAELDPDDSEIAAEIGLATLEQESSPVVRLVNSTLYDALKLNASDIHLEVDGKGLSVRYRIDGVLEEVRQVAGMALAEQVIQRIKVMAELDITERRVPQDGRFRVRMASGEKNNQLKRDVDFRVSIMPNIHAEDAVLRLLDRQSWQTPASGLSNESQASKLSLKALGLSDRACLLVRKLAQLPHGMLLVTGPTGSGKTTTLYATLSEIQSGRDKIVTIEDPVEYRLSRVLQIPVNEKKGLTFARGLRSILRHDPDKIMVGEIRDGETAQIAVQAALTGHLVFTTVHANNVFDVLGRFLHMGVDAYSFAAALNGIVAQRLLRMNCEYCSEIQDIPHDEQLNEFVANEMNTLTTQAVFKQGLGCTHCRGTGYKGRKAVVEVLMLDDEMREQITQRAPVSQLKSTALHKGWRSLKNEALDYAVRGQISLSEIKRVIG